LKGCSCIKVQITNEKFTYPGNGTGDGLEFAYFKENMLCVYLTPEMKDLIIGMTVTINGKEEIVLALRMLHLINQFFLMNCFEFQTITAFWMNERVVEYEQTNIMDHNDYRPSTWVPFALLCLLLGLLLFLGMVKAI